MLDLEAQHLMAESIPKVLSEDQNCSLAAIPSNEEIKNVVFSFDGDKAPGRDRFPMFFFQTFWDIVEKDVTNAIKKLFRARYFLKELNENFIVLILKLQGANSLDAFRSISL